MKGKPDLPILCVDFDGVVHSYSSPWKGAAVIPDDPVPGALAFLEAATEQFRVAIYSSRSNQVGGVVAMQEWLEKHAGRSAEWLRRIEWPMVKPPAMITIDDRAITFDGTWPDLATLKAFKPWNRR